MNEMNVSRRQIVSTRVFKASRELLWKAWTSPDHVAKWWGPNGFTNEFYEFEFKVGGVWRFDMIGPNGARYPNRNVFAELVEPEKIVLNHVSEPKFLLTVVFEKVPEGTKLTWTQLFETVEDYDKVKGVAIPGNEENLDRLGKVATSLA
ncbi:MAG: SRPBCC family protein [Spirochaetia bacterium]|nr:SRPBCC family protein [Spirochaetia bacterium]